MAWISFPLSSAYHYQRRRCRGARAASECTHVRLPTTQHVTLRVRLVAALVVLLTVGMVVFGVAVTSFHARSQYDVLDERLSTQAPFAAARLAREAGLNGFGGRRGPAGGPIQLGPDAYVELRDSDGDLLRSGTFSDGSNLPDIPADLSVDRSRFLTVDSAEGSGRWRVLVSEPDPFAGMVSVVAVPMGDVDDALGRLILIEVLSASVLLAILGVGSWFILRRGLRPLEQMACSAGSITASSLQASGGGAATSIERVSPADDQSEVGRLGRAINTMLAEIEEAFRERDATEERLRRFLADASHELRTPLTSIRGFAELFRLGAVEDREQLAVVLRRIENESDRMATLVEELLLLARLDQTRTPQRTPVDLAVLCADACTDASATAPDRRVTLHVPSPVVVTGDVDHLRQAIGNLVTNALRHTPAGSPIEVGARVHGQTAIVEVRDHGPGLDAEALGHVFDRFWQADDARVGAGTGLGLAIVAAIAEEHGGEVTVDNAPGGGASFSIRLPLSPPRSVLREHHPGGALAGQNGPGSADGVVGV